MRQPKTKEKETTAISSGRICKSTNLYWNYLMEVRLDVPLSEGNQIDTVYFTHHKHYTPGMKIEVQHPKLFENDLVIVEPTARFNDPEEIDKQIQEFLRLIPKTEIHLHIEGLVRKETLLQLTQKNQSNSNIKYMTDVERLFNFHNLTEFIQIFFAVQNNINHVRDFEPVFDDLVYYMEQNNIVYTEIFLAVTKFLQKGLKYPEIIEVLSSKIREYEADGPPRIRLLIDVSRGFGLENAMNNLDLVIQHKNEYVIGIGLGGAEKFGPAIEFQKCFEKALENNLHVVAHAGEDVGPESIWDAVEKLKAERLGHGIAAIEDEKLMDYLAKTQTPLEICVTSNIYTGRYTRDLSYHPVQAFYPKGMMITVNSDDPTFFNTDISNEYYIFYKHLNFSLSELMDILDKGIMATFYPDKQSLQNRLRKEIEQVKKKFPDILF